MLKETNSLIRLGWRPFYSQQLTLEDLDGSFPARVAAVQRSLLVVLSESGEHQIGLPQWLWPDRAMPGITVGDWVLIRRETLQAARMLERQSLVARMAAGTEPGRQAIAANVDTLFVVTSCNADFNPSRLERYLAVAFEAGVTPVIVLSKVDTCANPGAYIAAAGCVGDHAKRYGCGYFARFAQPLVGRGSNRGLGGFFGGRKIDASKLVARREQTRDARDSARRPKGTAHDDRSTSVSSTLRRLVDRHAGNARVEDWCG
jgi:hypothetical protein